MKLFRNFFKAAPMPKFTRKFGGFTVNVYCDEKHPDENYAEIVTDSDNIRLRFAASHEMYGYILSTASEGDEWQDVELLTYIMHYVATYLPQSQNFLNNIYECIRKHGIEVQKQAEELLKSASKQDEAIAQAEMEDVIAYSKMTDKERQQRKEDLKEAVKEVFAETAESEAKPARNSKRPAAKKRPDAAKKRNNKPKKNDASKG